MAGALDIVNTAQQQVGFVEGANNDNPYGTWYGMNHEPYCAMFVSWVFAQHNLSHLVAAQTPKGFAYCPAGLAWFQRKGRVIGKYDGKPGDLVFYSFEGTGQATHIEIIVGASKDGITTVGANTSPDHAINASQANGNGVYLRHRPYLYVLAIVRPEYETDLNPSVALRANPKVAAGVAGVTAVAGGGVAAVHNTTPVPSPSPTVFVAPPFPKTGITIGAQSNAVKAVELALIKAGLITDSNGTFNQADINAVKAWQKKHTKLNQKGVVDQATYDSLMTELK
jgi:hypothetical protein